MLRMLCRHVVHYVFFNACEKCPNHFIFLEQSFGIRRSLKCLLNFFYNDWALLIRHSRKASWVFFQKTYFFEVETTNHYFFCSILSDNEPMCGFSKKKEMFNKNTTRKKIFEKTNRIGKKSRTLSKHLVIAMSSSKWADSVLKLQNKDIMIIFRLFPGYFLLIDYLCTYTIPPISSQLKLKITISFILVLPWICTIIA